MNRPEIPTSTGCVSFWPFEITLPLSLLALSLTSSVRALISLGFLFPPPPSRPHAQERGGLNSILYSGRAHVPTLYCFSAPAALTFLKAKRGRLGCQRFPLQPSLPCPSSQRSRLNLKTTLLAINQ